MARQITKRVINAMGLFGGSQAITILCSIIRTKLIAIWIGPVGVGLFGIFNSVIDMLSSTTQLNIRQGAVRSLASRRGDDLRRMAQVLRWWALRLGLAGMLMMIAISPLLSDISFGKSGLWWQFAILSVALLANSYVNGEQALMQGTDRLKALASTSIWTAVLGTALSIPLFYCLGVQSIIPSILVFAAMGAVGVRIISQRALPMVSNLGFRAIPKEMWSEGMEFVKLGVYLTISTLAATSVSYIFLSYLNRVADTAQVGVYQAGYTLTVKYVGIIFTALAMEYYPRLSKVADRRKMTSAVVSHQLSILMAVLTAVIVVFIFVDRRIVLLLYDEMFVAAVPMITVGICGALFRAMSYCMSYVIVAKGDGRTFVATDVLSACIGLALNILCYHQWGLLGLGISYVAWYAIYTLIVGVVYFNRYQMRLSAKAWASAFAAMIVVGIALWMKGLLAS